MTHHSIDLVELNTFSLSILFNCQLSWCTIHIQSCMSGGGVDWWVCFKRMENGDESNTYSDRSHRVRTRISCPFHSILNSLVAMLTYSHQCGHQWWRMCGYCPLPLQENWELNEKDMISVCTTRVDEIYQYMCRFPLHSPFTWSTFTNPPPPPLIHDYMWTSASRELQLNKTDNENVVPRTRVDASIHMYV